ncbi:DHH family phosphoesterase [bacterium]|nr:DHH family phosphoesterase [bacterium]
MIINNYKNFVQPNFTANVMPKNCAEYIDNKLKAAKTADIFCHTSSDEDSFNSAKAMYSYLESQGVKSRIIVSNGKECYNYDTKKYNIIQADEVNENTQKSDIALCVDFSATSRAVPNVMKYINSYGANVVGFDHHNNPDKISTNYNQITQSYAKTQKMPELEAKNFYIDSSAKSNCAIISRFFDAIGHKINHEEGRSLLAGMLDDTSKDGFTKISQYGQIEVSDKTNDNDNTKTVMDNVLSKLNIFDKVSVLKHFSDKSKLTDKEINFQKTLDNRTQYSKNGKFAYLEIQQGDKEWEDMGKDTVRTKTVLGAYRKKMLENKNVDAVAVFFPTNMKDTYKMSILTKKDYAKQIIDEIKSTTCPELTAGGHDDRSGGTIASSDKQKCHEWVNLFVDAAEKVLH